MTELKKQELLTEKLEDYLFEICKSNVSEEAWDQIMSVDEAASMLNLKPEHVRGIVLIICEVSGMHL